MYAKYVCYHCAVLPKTFENALWLPKYFFKKNLNILLVQAAAKLCKALCNRAGSWCTSEKESLPAHAGRVSEPWVSLVFGS